jgi:hypothetical protein
MSDKDSISVVDGFVGERDECYFCKKKTNLKQVTIGYTKGADDKLVPNAFMMLCQNCKLSSVYLHIRNLFTEKDPEKFANWFDENFKEIIGDMWVKDVFISKPIDEITLNDVYLLDEYRAILAYKLRKENVNVFEELRVLDETQINLMAQEGKMDRNEILRQILVRDVSIEMEKEKKYQHNPDVEKFAEVVSTILNQYEISLKEFKNFLFVEVINN